MASTNEIFAYTITKNLKLDIVMDTIEKLMQNNSNSLYSEAFVHSD